MDPVPLKAYIVIISSYSLGIGRGCSIVVIPIKLRSAKDILQKVLCFTIYDVCLVPIVVHALTTPLQYDNVINNSCLNLHPREHTAWISYERPAGVAGATHFAKDGVSCHSTTKVK